MLRDNKVVAIRIGKGGILHGCVACIHVDGKAVLFGSTAVFAVDT